MMPSEWRDKEADAPVRCPAGCPDGKCCNTPHACELLPDDLPPQGDPVGCHGEQEYRIDHRLLDDLRAGWQAAGAMVENQNQIEYLRQRLWDAHLYIETMRLTSIKDVALLGLYRSAAMFALGLIEQAIGNDAVVAEVDKDRLWAEVTRADTLMLDLVDLIPAPTE